MMIVVVPVRAAALGERWAVLGGLTGLLLVHQLCIVGLLCMDKMTDRRIVSNPLWHFFGRIRIRIQPLNHSLIIFLCMYCYCFLMYVCMHVCMYV